MKPELQYTVKLGYESTVHDFESLFMQDRWGDFTATADSVRRRCKTLIDLGLSAIRKALNKLDKTGLRLKETTSLYSEHLKSSKRSQSNESRSCNTDTRLARAKAFTELAATKEQAEFDLLIAKKERVRKEREAKDELRRLTKKAKHDHDIAVLKAKKLAAVANAKLGAIEQAVRVEDLAMTSPLNNKHEDSKERTWTWLGDQQQVITDKINGETKQLQEKATPERNEFLIGDTTTHHRSSAFHGGLQDLTTNIDDTNLRTYSIVSMESSPQTNG